jgi:hypothetical protein
MLHNRIKTLQLLYYATLFCNLNIMLIVCLNYLCYIYYFFNTLIKYNGLQTLDSLIFTWFNGLFVGLLRPDIIFNNQGKRTWYRQGSILSFFGNANGPTQQKTTKSDKTMEPYSCRKLFLFCKAKLTKICVFTVIRR